MIRINELGDNDRKWNIYIITDPQGKKYVGMTTRDPEPMLQERCRLSVNPKLLEEITRKGWKHFKWEVLDKGLELKEASDKKAELIRKLRTDNPEIGYNGKPKEWGGKLDGWEQIMKS